jgi:hypothetical protein
MEKKKNIRFIVEKEKNGTGKAALISITKCTVNLQNITAGFL